MSVVTKAIITEQVAMELACTKAGAKAMVSQFFDKLVGEILIRDKVLLSGFGRFEKKRKAPRVARNMQTDEPVLLPERTVVTFRPSIKMREAVNGNMPIAGVSVNCLYKNDKNRDKNSELAARVIMTVIANALVAGDLVDIRGIGSFRVKEYKGYTGRNPKDGTPINIGPKKLPVFKPSRVLLRGANS